MGSLRTKTIPSLPHKRTGFAIRPPIPVTPRGRLNYAPLGQICLLLRQLMSLRKLPRYALRYRSPAPIHLVAPFARFTRTAEKRCGCYLARLRRFPLLLRATSLWVLRLIRKATPNTPKAHMHRRALAHKPQAAARPLPPPDRQPPNPRPCAVMPPLLSALALARPFSLLRPQRRAGFNGQWLSETGARLHGKRWLGSPLGGIGGSAHNLSGCAVLRAKAKKKRPQPASCSSVAVVAAALRSSPVRARPLSPLRVSIEPAARPNLLSLFLI